MLWARTAFAVILDSYGRLRVEMSLNQEPDGQPNPARGAGMRVVLLVGVVAAVGLGWLALQAHDSPAPASVDLQPTLIALSTELARAQTRSAEMNNEQASATPAEAETVRNAGGWLVYAAGEQGRSYLEAHRLGGPPPIRITAGGADRDPALSPDGSRLAFRSDRDGQWDLYLLELQTGEVERLTVTSAYEGHPTWSADGNWLAYEANSDGDLDIWILAVNIGSPPIQLTNHPGMDTSPHWDPAGGRRIAFISDRDGSRDVFLSDLDRPTDRFQNLTRTSELDEAHPGFSPDGKWIVYATEAQGLDLVWTLEPRRPDADPVQRGPGTRPVWSPDGSALLVTLRSPNEEHVVGYALGSQAPPSVSITGQGAAPLVDWGRAVPPVAAASKSDVSGDRSQAARSAVPQQQVGRMSLVNLGDLRAPNPTLVEAADLPFRSLRARVAEEVGWDFLGSLEHAFVGINDPLPPGYPYDDWLYTGRAFAFPQGLYRADWVEVVREDFGSQTYWRVYVRTAEQDGSQGEPLRRRPWDFDARYRGEPSDYDQGGREFENVPSGYYVDFTALARAYGFERQPALNNWQTFLPGARYNEFAFTEGLSWLEAMRQIYPEQAIATPTPFSSPTPTPTNTPWPTVTPWWWRWWTPSPTPTPTDTPVPTDTPAPTDTHLP